MTLFEDSKEDVYRKVNTESGGCLGKGWYCKDGVEYLVKGNSQKDGFPCFEPYSEVIAYRVAKALGLDTVEYTLADASLYPGIQVFGINHVSVCERILLADGEQLLSFGALIDLLFRDTPEDYLVAYAKLGLSYKELYRMLVFDALIGNEDRHLNNWDYIVSRAGIRPAPLLDHGASFMAMVPENSLGIGGNLYPDCSKPFEESHHEMIKLLKERLVTNLFDVQVDDVMGAFYRGLEEVKPYLSKKRVLSIENYFEVRLEHYLYPFIRKE